MAQRRALIALIALPCLIGALPLAAQPRLPGTVELTAEGDQAAAMVDRLRRHAVHLSAMRWRARESGWRRDHSSVDRYLASVAPQRARLRQLIGAGDARLAGDALGEGAWRRAEVVAAGDGVEVRRIDWPVFDRARARGLWLRPTGRSIAATVIALPDADQLPEQVASILPGIAAESRFARRLAASGCEVIAPVVLSRGSEHSGDPRVRNSDLPHREWIYRQAYEVGRHVIGYEVQAVLAAIDSVAARDAGRPIGVIGYGEGGLCASYAAALDSRIAAACVSGSFGERTDVFAEPIYRNVWCLLSEFGADGVASLIAPRALVIDASLGPTAGPSGSTPGRIRPIAIAATRRAFDRAARHWRELGAAGAIRLIGDGRGAFCGTECLRAFLVRLGVESEPAPASARALERRAEVDAAARMRDQIRDWTEHTQHLVREAHRARAPFWSSLDRSSLDAYRRSLAPHRARFAAELIGEVPPADAPPRPRSRILHRTERWVGHEVHVDVWDGVFARAILLVPRDLRDGERRPVVVCQHGLEGRAEQIVDPTRDTRAYHSYGARLADLGYVVLAPQNPYIGRDRFRVLQRIGNPVGFTLFSLITRQHQRLLDWLVTLPFVDAGRIAFYGLSYGGKTAMRVPPQLDRYCLSICSADFNEWLVKNTAVDARYSYMFTGEYDMAEFDLGHSFNYAEMAALIAPRPFMVERGHRDGVAPDEWVSWEYAKVRRLYAELGIPGRTRIEFFDGPHEIHGVGTFAFLREHLGWPR